MPEDPMGLHGDVVTVLEQAPVVVFEEKAPSDLEGVKTPSSRSRSSSHDSF